MAINNTELISVIKHLANIIAEDVIFGDTNEDDIYVKVYNQTCDYLKSNNSIDFNNLTHNDVKTLGFDKWLWSEDSNIYLIPLCLFPLIPDGYSVIKKNGFRIEWSYDKIRNMTKETAIFGLRISEK